jgi:hypothetical protein
VIEKNVWYLFKVEKMFVKELNTVFLICYYSNGIMERQLELKHGDLIKTIINYEWLD